MPTYNFTLYHDAGHAWLEIPYDLLIGLRIESTITQYSYERTIADVRYAFLEEDQDAETLLEALKKAGFHIEITHKYDGNQSNIRNYTPFGKNNSTFQPHRR